MALDARTRSSIYEKLRPILGDREANALMSEFPASEADELVTRQFLRTELAGLRMELHGEIGTLRLEMHDEIGTLRAEMHDEIGTLRAEMHDEIGTLRAEMHDQSGSLRAEMHEGIGHLRGELHDLGRQVVMWNTGSILTGIGLAVALTRIVG